MGEAQGPVLAEVPDALRLITLMERTGSMNLEEADAWRVGIAERAEQFDFGGGIVH